MPHILLQHRLVQRLSSNPLYPPDVPYIVEELVASQIAMMLVIGKDEDDVDEIAYLSDWEGCPNPLRLHSLARGSIPYATLNSVCRSIQSNDPRTKCIELQGVDFDSEGKLGNALQQNSHVSRIKVDIRTLQSGGASSLLHYISTSRTLRHVQFLGAEPCLDNHRVAKSLVSAVAQNANVAELTMAVVDPFSFSALVWVVKANLPSLKSLTFGVLNFLTVPALHVSLLASAVEANQTLGCLCISNAHAHREITQAILASLTSHPCLHQLTVSDYKHLLVNERIAYADELGAILTGSTTLTSLSMRGIPFDDVQMIRLVEALISSNSVISLTFDECRLSSLAKGILTTYLQTEVSSSSLRNLSISSIEHEQDLFPGMFSTFLLTPTTAIGSTLQSLSVILHANDPFWDDLYANAEHMRLAKLVYGVYRVDRETKDILFRSIPKFIHLRELCVPYDGNIALDAEFLDALRRNGSLHRANCQTLRGLARRRLEKADVYCDRNRFLPELLQGPFTDGSSYRLSLCPQLFVAVLPATLTAPNNVLLGLLTMADLIGPLRASKRAVNFPKTHRSKK
jgi:hypothetical protein